MLPISSIPACNRPNELLGKRFSSVTDTRGALCRRLGVGALLTSLLGRILQGCDSLFENHDLVRHLRLVYIPAKLADALLEQVLEIESLLRRWCVQSIDWLVNRGLRIRCVRSRYALTAFRGRLHVSGPFFTCPTPRASGGAADTRGCFVAVDASACMGPGCHRGLQHLDRAASPFRCHPHTPTVGLNPTPRTRCSRTSNTTPGRPSRGGSLVFYFLCQGKEERV